MKIYSLSSLVLVSALSLGCSFAARNPKSYSEDVESVISARKKEIKKCYDALLDKDEKAGGIVAVKFKVEAKSGEIKDVKVDEKKTTASKEVAACLVDNMGGLKIDPPDQREGHASFQFEFVGKRPKN